MAKQTTYGPDNPHPLSKMTTELVWDGKYDEYGNRREVDIAGCAMPMQKIETVDEPWGRAAEKGEQNLLAFEKENTRLDDFRNLLIWGDNKLIVASLLKQFKGKVDLVYIDPPFDVGADFTMDVPIGEDIETVEKDQSTLEMVAYKDTWGKGTDSYLHMMYERLVLIKELLSEKGSLFLHCDWHVGHYLKTLMDGIFGKSNFRNEIIWHYPDYLQGNVTKGFPRKNDMIFFYSKSNKFFFNRVKEPLNKPAKRNKVFWNKETQRMDLVRDANGKIIYESHEDKYCDTVWQIGQTCVTRPQATENLGYATQKPEEILRRIIEAATDKDGLIADFFCGSGTTGAVAERLGRKWIMADLGRFAIHTSRKRIIALQRSLSEEGKPYRAFDVYNLGRYERQWWQKERLEGADKEHRKVVLEFFKAEILENSPSPLIHGRKANAYCHVDDIDSIFTREEATTVAKAVKEAGGKKCYCLAWEFEMDLRLTTASIEQELGVKLMLIQIPREVMEKNRTSPPPFLEMAVLEAEPVLRKDKDGTTVDIKTTKFMPSLAEVPSKELEALKERAIKSGIDFIDFWAVDFDWHPDKPFNHHWQDYRTRKDRSLKTVSDAGHRYSKKGTYTACVKVIDTFGCDTSITVEVKV